MGKIVPQITTLDNGLRVITNTMSDTEAVTIELWTGVGSRYEKAEQNGISHFLEHMAFKGTKTRTARQIAEEFDNIGGQLNAHTSREHTVYYAKVLKDDFVKAADLLADIIQNSVFDSKELDLERQVVLQEISMTNDAPDDIVFDYYQKAAYGDQPIGKPILGTVDLVSGFNRDDLNAYVAEHYSASNLIFSVAGNVEHSVVVEFAKNSLAKIDKGSVSDVVAADYIGGQHREKRDLEQVHIALGFEGLSYKSDDIYVLQMMSSILGSGMSSRLFQEIRENRGLAYTIASFSSNYSDTGMFSVYSATSPDKISELINAVCDELNRATGDISEAELQKARSQAKAALLMAYESSGARASSMARRLICHGRYVTNEEILERINAVTVEQMKTLLASTISNSKLTIAAIGNLDQLEEHEAISQRLAA